jgi:hypothetical protein
MKGLTNSMETLSGPIYASLRHEHLSKKNVTTDPILLSTAVYVVQRI